MNSLKTYIKGLPDDAARVAFAQRCGTSLQHIKNVMYGSKPCGADLAVALERESGGALVCDALCPDAVFRRIKEPGWPKGKPYLDLQPAAA